MKIPSLEDVSPNYANGLKKLDGLKQWCGQVKDNYRSLINQKASGVRADQESRVQALMNGQMPSPATNLDAMIDNERANYDAIETAIHIRSGVNAKLATEAAKSICDQVKPAHDVAMKEFCSGMLAAHKALAKLHQLKWTLINSGVGLHGLFKVDVPDDLEGPLDRSSSLGDFFRAAKAEGFISTVPVELR